MAQNVGNDSNSNSSTSIMVKNELQAQSHKRLQTLIDICSDNATYFEKDTSKNGTCLHKSFTELIKHAQAIIPLLDQVCIAAPQYDFDSNVQANGYRSFVAVVDIAVSYCLVLNEQVQAERNSFLFRKQKYKKDLNAYTQLLGSLVNFFNYIVMLINRSEGELILVKIDSLVDFLKLGEVVDTVCFYGRCLGFQFCKSMRPILRNVATGMVTYSKVYHSKKWKWVRSLHWVWTGGKYVLNPELRARKIVQVSQFASVDFCKSFWLLAESGLVGHIPSLICPKVAVNQVIPIPPDPLDHVSPGGKKIPIQVPESHLERAPIYTRLLSTVRREGMEGPGSAVPRSRHLLFHCHGGGFVAQSSRSHEIYLRDWASQLDMPILSVDYSLAPSAPYPRALEEVVYAYVWALANCARLGTTGEHVILAGDSAGANLCLGLALKCIDLGLTPPKGLFLAYVPVLISSAPSPSRLLSLMDPLLPYSFMLSCLEAYAGHMGGSVANIKSDERTSGQNDCNGKPRVEGSKVTVDVATVHQGNCDVLPSVESCVTTGVVSEKDCSLSSDPFLSPYRATDEALSQLPPISIMSVEFDPCLDDCVTFARRLKSLDRKITFNVLCGLPHGFLNFTMMSDEAHEGSNFCVKRIKELLEGVVQETHPLLVDDTETLE